MAIKKSNKSRNTKNIRLPLLQYGSAVEDSIFRVLKSEIRYNDWNTFLRLKTLYFIAAFLGWCQIFAKESLIEYVEYDLASPKNIRIFNAHYHNIFTGISSIHYFSTSEETFKDAYTTSVPGLVATAIGDIMIKDYQSHKSLFPQVMGFREFQSNYEKNPEFKEWIRHIENILNYNTKSEDDMKWNRIIIFYTYLYVFTDFLEGRNKKILVKMRDSINKIIKAPRARCIIILDGICENIRPTVKALLSNDLKMMGYRISYEY